MYENEVTGYVYIKPIKVVRIRKKNKNGNRPVKVVLSNSHYVYSVVGIVIKKVKIV